jgi:hypothetical protein
MWHVWRTGEVRTGFWWENLRGHHWEDQGVDGMIILKLNFKMWFGSMDRITLAEARDRWRGLVNAEMKLWVSPSIGASPLCAH